MNRRTQTVYVTVDPFFSLRGAVLHRFDEFLEGVADLDCPCIWITGMTRAQLDEPRRRLGQNAPFIGESGSGVYLPEDYFHLKAGKTVRLGRFTCIPVAKQQPAAAEALEELAGDLGIAVVPLRGLSPRELSQNTGLRGAEAEQIRMRDFDELFFFAGASELDVAKFEQEAKKRGLALQNLGTFWSLSCGADYGKCIQELGGLYDRALRGHALRTAAIVVPSDEAVEIGKKNDPRIRGIAGACDRTIFLSEKMSSATAAEEAHRDGATLEERLNEHAVRPLRSSFYMHSPSVWEEALALILAKQR